MELLTAHGAPASACPPVGYPSFHLGSSACRAGAAAWLPDLQRMVVLARAQLAARLATQRSLPAYLASALQRPPASASTQLAAQMATGAAEAEVRRVHWPGVSVFV